MNTTTNTAEVGAYHLASAKNYDLFEPQRNNNFVFIVTDLDGILRVGTTGTDDNDKISNAQEVLKLSVDQASIPMFTQEVITIKRGNSVVKAAGAPTFSDGNIVVNDYIGADSKSVLLAWQNLSYNVATDKVGRMSQYKKVCYLNEYTPDYRLVRSWKLLGCWVAGLSEDAFSMGDSGKKTISATIAYDRAIMEMPDEEL